MPASNDMLSGCEPGGLRQLLFDDDPAGIAEQVLASYYARWAATEVIGA